MLDSLFPNGIQTTYQASMAELCYGVTLIFKKLALAIPPLVIGAIAVIILSFFGWQRWRTPRGYVSAKDHTKKSFDDIMVLIVCALAETTLILVIWYYIALYQVIAAMGIVSP